MNFGELSKEELEQAHQALLKEYRAFQQKGLKLDMSRGKPGADQFDLCNGLLTAVKSGTDAKSESGTDCRNYGLVDGLPEMKRIFADILQVQPEEVIVGGNSSLNMMFDVIAQGVTTGFGQGPWAGQGKLKFLCPSPGYDRHFAVTEYFGFELIPVEMTPNGPDMDEVERLVQDEAVKGIWCVPKYSNPEGVTYSAQTVKRLAGLKPAARDFRIMWDNSYGVHDLYDTTDELLPILEECKRAGNPDLVFLFTSTSKISFSGGGVAAMACSENNRAMLLKRLSMQTIGPDKVNQLRHVRFFKDINGVKEHMKKHAAMLRPKFQVVLDALQRELNGVAAWNVPKGGYFVSLNTADGCAKRVVELCKEAGVVLTPAGATYPYGLDRRDRNIRIAPTFPPVEELEQAMELFCIAVKLATAEKYLGC